MSGKDLDRPISTDEIKRIQLREEAERLHRELGEKQGKKALLLIVDDDLNKAENTQKLLEYPARSKDYGFVFSAQSDGIDGIILYEEFRTADSGLNPTTVALAMDQNLTDLNPETIYRTSNQVVQKIVEISIEKGWPMPLIVGNSTSSNYELRRKFPEQYLAGIAEDRPFQIVTRIAERIPS